MSKTDKTSKNSVFDVYCERIFKLFEKHRPGKYTKDYVSTILKNNTKRLIVHQSS